MLDRLFIALLVLGAACEREPAPRPTRWEPDCSTAHAPRPDRDPSPMCRVPGEREFYIDQHEVTAEQAARFLTAVGNTCKGGDDDRCASIEETRGDVWYGRHATVVRVADRYEARAGGERRPINDLYWEGARAYCEWAGKSLPTEAQWLRAAHYDPASGRTRRYPWGDEFVPRRANCSEKDCADGFAPGDDRRLAPVGSFPTGASAIGALDMAGNVREWTADCNDQGRCIARGGDLSSHAAELLSPMRGLSVTTEGVRCVR